MLRKLAMIVLVLLFCFCGLLLLTAESDQWVFVMPMLVIVLVLRKLRRKKQPAASDAPIKSTNKQTAPIEKSRPDTNFDTLIFSVVGVSYERRQEYLQKISDYEAPFVLPSYDIRESEYKGELSYEVVAVLDNGSVKVLGHVPKDLIARVHEIMNHTPLVEVVIYGGQDGKYYGARCELSWKANG